jgi:dipeptidase
MTLSRLKTILGSLVLIFLLMFFFGSGNPQESAHNPNEGYNFQAGMGCTDVIVGKGASADGSVMTSQTGCAAECRIHVVPSQSFKSGEMAPVYWGIQEVKKSIHDFGQIIGKIPQIEKTYSYIHSGYPHINEHQLAIGETTLSQKKELKVFYPVAKQIMTIEQAQLFALQRTKTARGALALITSLLEVYGFLPSCDVDGEALCIADPNEAWVLEVFSVGKGWTPNSGRLGVIWAAQRVPDDHIVIVPNTSRIREINLDDPENFKASKNYKQVAINRGWYDPSSGKPFIWQEAYAPPPTEGNMNRIWLFHKCFAPNLKKYHSFDPISYYPFSIKPEKKVSVQDVMTFQRSVFAETIFDMTADLDWLVPDRNGRMMKSPLTTPFPTRDMRELLDIKWHRNVSQGGYGMVAQLRSWLPAPIGGVYWFYIDNQHTSIYVPIYAGVTDISPLYQTYDPDQFSEGSARWAFDFVDNLLYLKWQDAIKDLRAARDPLETRFFAEQKDIDNEAFKLYRNNPELATKFLTEYTDQCMEEVVELYRELRYLLISKYTNNKQGTNNPYRGDDFEYKWPR